MELVDWLKQQGIVLEVPWLTVGEVFTLIFATLLANYLVRRFYDRLALRLAKTRNVWDDILLEAARRPSAILVWVVGFSWAAQVLAQEAPSEILALVEPARELAVILLLAWFAARLVRNAEQVLVAPDKVQKPLDRTTALALGKLLRASIFITAALVVLQTLGFSISGVLAFGGIGGIAVGFAAKDLLANFFGGLMIFLDRPFVVGDWVRSPDKEIEGTVEYIGWRLTRIRTFDKRPIYVPNATFANITVENPSRMTHRRIKETIGVRYGDADRVEEIVAAVRQMLNEHTEIDTAQTLIVNLNTFGPSALEFFVYAFTKTTDWVRYHEIKQDVLVRILAIVEQHGAEVAFPTRTLHFARDASSGGEAHAPTPAQGAERSALS